MTIFTDGARTQAAAPGVHELPSSFLDAVGANTSLDTLPSAQLLGMGELAAAKGEPVALDEFGSTLQLNDLPETPMAEAKARVKQLGLDTHLDLGGGDTVKTPALDIMIRRAQEAREREATMARGPTGSGVAGAVAGLAVGAFDPLNVAAAFIPVVGELRYAKLLASAGTGTLARAGVRAGVGATQGAVGSVPLIGLEAAAHSQEGQDFTMADALHQLVYGAALGGALHSGGGAVADIVRRYRGQPLYPFGEGEPFSANRAQPGGAPAAPSGPEAPDGSATEATGLPGRPGLLGGPASPEVTAIGDLPPAAKEAAMRAGLAQMIGGERLSVGELVHDAARRDPRIAEALYDHESPIPSPQARALAAERRDWPQPPAGAEISGHGELGPVVTGLSGRWAETVDWLKRAQAGDVLGGLEHPAIGPIDVIWGESGANGYGLAHILERHPEVVPDLPQRLARMEIDHIVKPGAPGERVVLRSPDGAEQAVIRTTFENDRKVWLLTAFTPESDHRPGPGGGRTGSPPDKGPTRSSARPGGKLDAGPDAGKGAPLTLLQFIAKRGGISSKDPLAADLLQSFGGENPTVRGFGKLLRDDGKPLDRAREAAVEAGYLHDAGRESGTVSDSTINHLLEAVDAEARGRKQYPAGLGGHRTADEIAHATEQSEAMAERHAAQVDAELERLLDQRGVGGLRKFIKRRAESLLAQGERDPENALDRAIADFSDTAADVRPSVPSYDEPELLAASREADALATPKSLSPKAAERLAAAKASLAEAEALYEAAEDYLPPDMRERLQAEVEAFDQAARDREEVITRGAACLSAASGG